MLVAALRFLLPLNCSFLFRTLLNGRAASTFAVLTARFRGCPDEFGNLGLFPIWSLLISTMTLTVLTFVMSFCLRLAIVSKFVSSLLTLVFRTRFAVLMQLVGCVASTLPFQRSCAFAARTLNNYWSEVFRSFRMFLVVTSSLVLMLWIASDY